LSEQDLAEEMKKYSVRGYTIPPRERYKYKGESAIGFGTAFGKIKEEDIAARIEQLREEMEQLMKARQEQQQEQPQEQIQVQPQPKKKKKETKQ
jgi:hypothetical protein